MESFLEILKQYGSTVYLILFLYCALKSGWLPLFAGYAAHAEALELMYVVIAVFAGGYLGDEIRFYLARSYGHLWLNKPTKLASLLKYARALADRYGVLYVFIYRYPKGLRTVGALPLGLTDISWQYFTLLNISSALLWVFLLVGAGYSFGASFDAFGINNLTTFSILLLCIFCVSLFQVLRAKERVNLETITPSTKHNRGVDNAK